MKVNEFLESEVGIIVKCLYDKGHSLEEIYNDLKVMDESNQIRAIAIRDIPMFPSRYLEDFINHSRWGQRIRKQIKYLNERKRHIAIAIMKMEDEEEQKGAKHVTTND